MTPRRGLRVLALAALLAAPAASAFEVQTWSPAFSLNISPQLQARYEGDFDGPPGTAGPGGHGNSDLFMRRARLLLTGTAFEKFTFEIRFAMINLGKNGNYNVPLFLQDIWIGYVPVEDVNIESGLLFMPLTHAATESAVYKSAVEGPADILLYNGDVGADGKHTQREAGVQLRGLFFSKALLVRLGLFEGARSSPTAPAPRLNPNGIPLAGGMIRLNLVGFERTFTYPSIYLDGRTRISVGVGAQYQPQSGGLEPARRAYHDYLALGADVFADVATSESTEAVVSLGGYRFDYGDTDVRTGNGAQGELGFRWGRFEPQGNFYWYNSDTKRNSYRKVAGGLNVFFEGHHAKLQLEFASYVKNGNLRTTPSAHQVVVQMQLAF